MSLSTVNNARIAKNTLLLYFRMIFLMLISLYTSRRILAELGVDDYGVYNVVSGFIIMLSFINGALSSSTSRYITFALGRNDKTWLNCVFSTCLQAHIAISIVILLVGETFGLWIINNMLVIPDHRIQAALWVYQCSIAATVLSVWSIPYNACIIAHEKMSAFAYISIFEALAKLSIAVIIGWCTVDRLILYAVLILIVQLTIGVIYILYGIRHFDETKPKLILKKALLKETFSFAGWNLWGGLAVAMFTQGVNFLLNIFFGPVVNAARGLAVTVQSAVQQFASNFQTALNPQIIKSYASGNLKDMHLLICRSSKFTFFLVFCLALPIICETPFILGLWLKDVPEYTVSFVRIMLCICIVDAMANPFMTAISATGKVKKYQCVIGGIQLSIVPLAYLALKFGGIPITVFYVQYIVFIIAFFARMMIAADMVKFSISNYISITVIPVVIVGVLSVMASLSLKYVLSDNFLSSIIVIASSIFFVIILSYKLGLTNGERSFIRDKILQKIFFR